MVVTPHVTKRTFDFFPAETPDDHAGTGGMMMVSLFKCEAGASHKNVERIYMPARICKGFDSWPAPGGPLNATKVEPRHYFTA